jgi:putative membrane protein
MTTAWNSEPGMWVALVLTAWLYAAGLRALWRHAGPGAGIGRTEATAFGLGWLALVVATMSPLDALATLSFAAHMVQHELMVLVAAPLIVLGRPLPAMLWGMPARLRPAAARLLRASGIGRLARALGTPAIATLLHAVVLWAWHAPPLVELSMASHWAHHLQHGAFFGSALLFWSAVLGTVRGPIPGRRAARSGARHGAPEAPAIGMAWLLVTLLHTSMLGAVLAFAPTPLYPHYVVAAPTLGLSALADQQLAGLVMWVPGGIAYLVAALVLLARLLGGADLPMRLATRPTPPPSAPR